MSDYTQFLNEFRGVPLLFGLKRTIEPKADRRCFLVDFERHLLLVETFDLDTFRLNGFAVMRHDDVKSYQPWMDTNDWPYPAMRRLRVRPSPAPKVNLGSMTAAALSAAKVAPLISVHREEKYPNECWIGRNLKCNRRSLTLETISPMAEWEGAYRMDLKDITMIEFGDGYSKALAFNC